MYMYMYSRVTQSRPFVLGRSAYSESERAAAAAAPAAAAAANPAATAASLPVSASRHGRLSPPWTHTRYCTAKS